MSALSTLAKKNATKRPRSNKSQSHTYCALSYHTWRPGRGHRQAGVCIVSNGKSTAAGPVRAKMGIASVSLQHGDDVNAKAGRSETKTLTFALSAVCRDICRPRCCSPEALVSFSFVKTRPHRRININYLVPEFPFPGIQQSFSVMLQDMNRDFSLPSTKDCLRQKKLTSPVSTTRARHSHFTPQSEQVTWTDIRRWFLNSTLRKSLK